ncbi:MAG: nucleotidyl transferase AbiEii/AbiGii toxin family protein, partial [Gammaproteobacteria bacterium]|nr:nucleotidyl transferase AbiEii/AbiGii toxin family protein [Gammaproteobacteria bacterium]
MTRSASGNPESIRARLLNRARADNVEFQQLLTRFALERILYRLSISTHRDQFLLKGALLFNLWYSAPHRPTRDVDFLGFGSDDLGRIESVFRDLCELAVPDGIVFDPRSVRAAEIRLEANY